MARSSDMRRRGIAGLIFGVLALALALVAMGCGSGDSGSSTGAAASGDSSSGAKKRIAVVVPLSNTFTAALYDGIKAAAEGRDVELKVFDPGFDPQRAYAQIQQITAQNYDAIAMLPLDPATAVPVVRAAADKGIKVVSMNNPLGPDMRTLDPQVPGQTANVMDASQYQRGVWLGELAVDSCADKDPCEVSYIAGSVALAGEQALIGGFREAIAANPAIKLVAYVDAGDYTAEPGQRAGQNIIAANPEVRVIAGSGDQIIRGAGIAVRAAGREGEIGLIGLGGSKAGVQGVIDGSWYGTVANLPYSIGVESFKVLERAFADDSVRGVAVDVAKELDLDPKITSENAGDFRAEWDG